MSATPVIFHCVPDFSRFEAVKELRLGTEAFLQRQRQRAPSREDGVVQSFAAEVGDVLHECHD
jgi:hypothetical protein